MFSEWKANLFGEPEIVILPKILDPTSKLEIKKMLYDGKTSCFFEECTLAKVPEQNIENILNHNTVYAMVGNFSILGIVCIKELHKEAFLHSFCIKHESRFSGYGTRLLDAVKNRHSRISLSVFRNGSHRKSLLKFYKKAGFKRAKYTDEDSNYIKMTNF